MADTLWTCPKCGPVKEILNGKDDKEHCLECDSVVKFNREPTTRSVVNPHKYRPPTIAVKDMSEQVKIDRAKRKVSDVASREGKAILATIQARQAGLRQRKPEEPMNTAHNGSQSRQGVCHLCKKDKWLIRRDPATCSPCWDKISVAKARGEAAPTPVPDKAPASPKARPAPPPPAQPAPTPLPVAPRAPERVEDPVVNKPAAKINRHSMYDADYRARVVQMAKDNPKLSQREVGEKMDPPISQAQVSQMCRAAGLHREPVTTRKSVMKKETPMVKPADKPDRKETTRLKRAAEVERQGRIVDGKRLQRDREETVTHQVSVMDDIDAEINAVAQVSRALENLDEDGIRRVVGFALDRAAKRLGRTLLLPPPKTTE